MRFETTIVKDGDEGMPSLDACTLAAQALGMGIGQMVAMDGKLVGVRIPHPPPVVRTLLVLALNIDVARSFHTEATVEWAEMEVSGGKSADVGPVIASELYDDEEEDTGVPVIGIATVGKTILNGDGSVTHASEESTMDVFACDHGIVHMTLAMPAVKVSASCPPENALRFAEDVRAVAAGLIAAKEGEVDGGATEA